MIRQVRKGEAAVVGRWQGGKGARVVRWQGVKVRRVVKWQEGGSWFYSRVGGTG